MARFCVEARRVFTQEAAPPGNQIQTHSKKVVALHPEDREGPGKAFMTRAEKRRQSLGNTGERLDRH